MSGTQSNFAIDAHRRNGRGVWSCDVLYVLQCSYAVVSSGVVGDSSTDVMALLRLRRTEGDATRAPNFFGYLFVVAGRYSDAECDAVGSAILRNVRWKPLSKDLSQNPASAEDKDLSVRRECLRR